MDNGLESKIEEVLEMTREFGSYLEVIYLLTFQLLLNL